MPITQTMTFTATPPTTGETPTTFNYNAIACWNELKLNVVPDLNVAFTEMSALEANVNAKEASAVASAEAAVSAANFKGSWSSATSYTIGDSVIYLGITYRALLSGSNQNPTTATTYWSPLSIASSIKYTPSGEVSATTVQGAIDELSTEKLSVVNIHSATDKTTPVDADELSLVDSASSFSLKKLTLANLKSFLKIGTTTNDDASAGQIGEYVSSTLLSSSPISLTTTIISSVTSINLTAGDWDIRGKAIFDSSVTTNVVSITVGTNTSVAFGADLESRVQTIFPGGVVINTTSTGAVHIPASVMRVSLNAPTTVHLVARGYFTVSTLTVAGTISARRVR